MFNNKLMKALGKALNNQRGDAVLIWCVFALILMSGFTALTVQTGDLLIRKHYVQAAADASALSGASAVQSILNFNAATMLPSPHPSNGQIEQTVLNTDGNDGGEAKRYAQEILDYNKELMEFERKGIVLDNIMIDGRPREALEAIVSSPIEITDVDGTINTYYRNFGVVLNGYMEAPLWGAFFGNDKVPFSIPAGAMPLDQ